MNEQDDLDKDTPPDKPKKELRFTIKGSFDVGNMDPTVALAALKQAVGDLREQGAEVESKMHMPRLTSVAL